MKSWNDALLNGRHNLKLSTEDMQKEITVRRRAEEELKKHEERLEELVKERTRTD